MQQKAANGLFVCYRSQSLSCLPLGSMPLAMVHPCSRCHCTWLCHHIDQTLSGSGNRHQQRGACTAPHSSHSGGSASSKWGGEACRGGCARIPCRAAQGYPGRARLPCYVMMRWMCNDLLLEELCAVLLQESDCDAPDKSTLSVMQVHAWHVYLKHSTTATTRFDQVTDCYCP